VSDLDPIISKWLREHEGGPEVWGPQYWHWFHEIADAIPCSECRPKGQMMISGMHDIVSILKNGRCAYDPKSLRFLKEASQKAWEVHSHKHSCVNTGNKPCHGRRCN
jgi:hypothetical protein